jgi:asparagine synthase (glutamine-hydrolysing)
MRDRLGTKTTFFMNHVDGPAFATQATALLAHPAVSANVERERLNELTGTRRARTPRCGIIRDVQEVLPGEVVQVTPQSISRGRY